MYRILAAVVPPLVIGSAGSVLGNVAGKAIGRPFGREVAQKAGRLGADAASTIFGLVAAGGVLGCAAVAVGASNLWRHGSIFGSSDAYLAGRN